MNPVSWFRPRIVTAFSLCLVAGVGALDFATGARISILPVYFVPMALTAWYGNLALASLTSLAASVVWFLAIDPLSHGRGTPIVYDYWNAAMRLVSFLAMSFFVARVRHLYRRQQELTRELGQAVVQSLKGFLPICAKCHKIREPTGEWLRLEQYLHKHTAAQLSHGLCRECAVALAKEAGIPFDPDQPAWDSPPSPPEKS